MPVGGLVEHEHGIVDLRGDKQHRFLVPARALLPRGILPDLSPSQVLQGGSATDGQKGGGRGRRATGYKEEAGRRRRRRRGAREEEILYNKLLLLLLLLDVTEL